MCFVEAKDYFLVDGLWWLFHTHVKNEDCDVYGNYLEMKMIGDLFTVIKSLKTSELQKFEKNIKVKFNFFD